MTLPELSAKISGAIAGKVKLLLDGKVDKIAGKVLSTNDYTTAEKNKLSGIEAQANKTVIDTTLSNAGQAADAKTTGDDFAVLRDYLRRMESYCEASGNPATFSDAKAANVKSLSVTITPTQSGSGDPSPTNVRPISGVSSVTVTRTGENGANPQTVTVTLTDGSNPLTVYGGTLDVTTGKLVVTHQVFRLGEMASNTGIRTTPAGNRAVYFNINDIPNGKAGDVFLSSHFQCKPAFSSDSTNVTNGLPADSITLKVASKTVFVNPSASYASVDEFKTWAAGADAQIVYPLETPVTYQLTPQQLATLSGYNAVSSDAGAVDVTYKADTSIILGGD